MESESNVGFTYIQFDRQKTGWYVEIDSTISNFMNVTRGVPQGSISSLRKCSSTVHVFLRDFCLRMTQT